MLFRHGIMAGAIKTLRHAMLHGRKLDSLARQESNFLCFPFGLEKK